MKSLSSSRSTSPKTIEGAVSKSVTLSPEGGGGEGCQGSEFVCPDLMGREKGREARTRQTVVPQEGAEADALGQALPLSVPGHLGRCKCGCKCGCKGVRV